MAKKYIDADEFLKSETKRCGCIPLVGSCTTDNESLSYRLVRAPTADVVEVVRCKDCKHCVEDIICEGVVYCNEHHKGMRENDYCSYGERRKDDE